MTWARHLPNIIADIEPIESASYANRNHASTIGGTNTG
jgi:hypothetical protein